MAIKLEIGKVYLLRCGGVVRIGPRETEGRKFFSCKLLNHGFSWTNMGLYTRDSIGYWEDRMRDGVAWFWEDGMVDCRETGHPLNVVRELEP